MPFTYRYARPALTADCVVFAFAESRLKVLLIQRANEPFKNQWALPGGFAEVGESLENTARRELEEETGLRDIFLEQLRTFSDPKRDPREHVVTVAYFALVCWESCKIKAASDASAVGWFAIDELPTLAFDHDQILQAACDRLRQKMTDLPIGVEFLPEKFPLRILQDVYETVLDRPIDKRNFRKKFLQMGILAELGECESDVSHRAAKLYRVNKEGYARKIKNAYNFKD